MIATILETLIYGGLRIQTSGSFRVWIPTYHLCELGLGTSVSLFIKWGVNTYLIGMVYEST